MDAALKLDRVVDLVGGGPVIYRAYPVKYTSILVY